MADRKVAGVGSSPRSAEGMEMGLHFKQSILASVLSCGKLARAI